MEIAVFLLLVSMGMSNQIETLEKDISILETELIQLAQEQEEDFLSLAVDHSAFSARSEVHDDRHDRRLEVLESEINLLKEKATQ